MFRSLSKALLIALIVVMPVYALTDEGHAGYWLLIDTKALSLTVMHEDMPVKSFPNISIGRNGAGYDKKQGDDKTPLGHFKVAWINEKSRYYRFFGLTYPGIEHAKRAYKNGIIDRDIYHRLIRATIFDRTPPQDTPLGGQIGIHGIGEGDARIHSTMNWTHGCVALTNEQIDQLSRWIEKGTVVVIQ